MVARRWHVKRGRIPQTRVKQLEEDRGARRTMLHKTNAPNIRNAVFVAFLAIVIAAVQRVFLIVSAVTVSNIYHEGPTLKRLLIAGYNRWDSWYYIRISTQGYTSFKETAFWPFYPFLMRIVHEITGLSYKLSGVTVSMACFIIALFFLGQLVHQVFSLRIAGIAMVLYGFFPTSYYFVSTYTEATFMALVIASAYFAHRGHFLVAGIVAAMATLTRNTGILVCIILLGELIRIRHPGWNIRRLDWWKGAAIPLLSLTFAPIALVGYCIWLQSRFGNFLAFVDAQKIWHRAHMEPWDTIARAFEFYLGPHPHTKTPGYTLFEIVCLLFAMCTLALGLFLVDRSWSKWAWWTYAAAVIWVICAAPALGKTPDFLMSVPRFVLMLFPCFIFLARALKTLMGTSLVLGIFATVLFVENAMFYAGMWIA